MANISFTFFSSKKYEKGKKLPPPSPRNHNKIKESAKSIAKAYELVTKPKPKYKDYQKAAQLLAGVDSKLNSEMFTPLTALPLNTIEQLIETNPDCAKTLAKDPRLSQNIVDFPSLFAYLELSPWFSCFALIDSNYFYLADGDHLASVFKYIKTEADEILFTYELQSHINSDTQLLLAAQHLTPKTVDSLLRYHKNLLVDSSIILEFIVHAPQQIDLLDDPRFYRQRTAQELSNFIGIMEAYAESNTPKGAASAFALAKVYHHGYADIRANPKSALKYFNLAKAKGYIDADAFLSPPKNDADQQYRQTM